MNIINGIKKYKKTEEELFNKNKKIVPIYVRGDFRSWGSTINFSCDGKASVYGWLKRIPRKGEYLIDNVNIELDLFPVYRFDYIEKSKNPTDMFFANVVKVGECDKDKNLIQTG